MSYLLNPERPYYTYAHYKADTGEIFYIGKGKSNRAFNSRSDHWKNVVNKHGLIVKIIADFEHEVDAFKMEIHLIAMIGRKDKGIGPLINLTDGGDGASGCIRTAITKNKMSVAKSNKTYEEIYGAKKAELLRQKRKTQTRQDYSKRVYSSESRAEMSRKAKDFANTPKEKENRSARFRGINNPKIDLTIYEWVHPIYGTELCCRFALKQKYPDQYINTYHLKKVILKTRSQYKGWSLKQ